MPSGRGRCQIKEEDARWRRNILGGSDRCHAEEKMPGEGGRCQEEEEDAKWRRKMAD